jgi:3-hydroxyacyl-[acyl-carrier-protein] dehydratase
MSLQADIERAMLSFDAEATSGVARLRFAGDEIFFKGHFPEGPVLPAVVQVAAAVLFAGKLLGQEVQLAEVTRAKFTNPTGPQRELTLKVDVEPAEQGRYRAKALLRDGELVVAELNLRVQPA